MLLIHLNFRMYQQSICFTKKKKKNSGKLGTKIIKRGYEETDRALKTLKQDFRHIVYIRTKVLHDQILCSFL